MPCLRGTALRKTVHKSERKVERLTHTWSHNNIFFGSGGPAVGAEPPLPFPESFPGIYSWSFSFSGVISRGWIPNFEIRLPELLYIGFCFGPGQRHSFQSIQGRKEKPDGRGQALSPLPQMVRLISWKLSLGSGGPAVGAEPPLPFPDLFPGIYSLPFGFSGWYSEFPDPLIEARISNLHPRSFYTLASVFGPAGGTSFFILF
jgi:hypothetical protein